MTGASSPAARAVEAVLATIGGVILGAALGLPGGWPVATVLGTAAGTNGALGGYRQVYDWRSGRGWAAFAADCTWGLAGTTLGTLLHLVDLALPRAGYREDLSRRRNRHWFEGGARLRSGFVLTLGNVVSDPSPARQARPEKGQRAIDRHEEVHVWQNRAFGPLYPAGYAAWVALGALAALGFWAVRGGKVGLFSSVEAIAYYRNPFESWAYHRDGRGTRGRLSPEQGGLTRRSRDPQGPRSPAG